MSDAWVRPFAVGVDDLRSFVSSEPEARVSYFLERWTRCGVATFKGGAAALAGALGRFTTQHHRIRQVYEGVAGKIYPVLDDATETTIARLADWELLLGSHKVPDCIVLVDNHRERLSGILRECARGVQRVTVIDRYAPGKCTKGRTPARESAMGRFMSIISSANPNGGVELCVYTGEHNHDDGAEDTPRRITRREAEDLFKAVQPSDAPLNLNLHVFKKSIFYNLCHDRFIAFEHASGVRHVVQIGNGFDALGSTGKECPPITVSRVLPQHFTELRNRLNDAWTHHPDWRAPLPA